jgi:hypothetical protein
MVSEVSAIEVASTTLRAAGIGPDRGALVRDIHRAKKRAEGGARRQPSGQCGLHAPDLALARQEDEDAALGLLHRIEDIARDGGLARAVLRQGTVAPARRDREGAACRGHDRRVHQARHGRRVERGGHGEKDHVLAERRPDLEREREPEVGVERAFVELVEDHGAHARKPGVRLDHPGQDPFGHDLDARLAPRLRLAPDAVADGAAHRLAQGLGHALGRGAGGEAARLQHDDPAGGDPRLEHGQRHPGGFPRAWRRLKDGAAARPQGGEQVRNGVLDGQGVGHGPAYRRSRVALP